MTVYFKQYINGLRYSPVGPPPSLNSIHQQKKSIGKSHLIAMDFKLHKLPSDLGNKKQKENTTPYTTIMGSKFQQGGKIRYVDLGTHKKGKVDSVHDFGKGRYEYSITLEEQLTTWTT